MASLARSAGRKMVRRLGHRCNSGKALSIVAGCAAAEDAGMYHCRSRERRELVRRMAALAGSAGRKMVRRLGHRRHPGKALTIVTGCAAAEDAGMDHRRSGERCELARRMASLARRGGRQMVRRLGHRRHSGKALAIVAGCAIVHDAQVTHHPGTRAKSRGMAGCASLCRRQMVRWHCSCARARETGCRTMAV